MTKTSPPPTFPRLFRRWVRPPRGTVMLTFDVPTGWSAVALVVLVAVLLAVDLPGLTVALLTAGTGNPANEVQANTVRLATEGGEGPAFVVPALMPGETVDRAIGIRSTGTGDARLDLAVVPETTGALVSDLATGLSLTVDRCRNGAWATTTPVVGVATPPVGGARLACAVTPGALPSVEALYQGPIIPRGAVTTGGATVGGGGPCRLPGAGCAAGRCG